LNVEDSSDEEENNYTDSTEKDIFFKNIFLLSRFHFGIPIDDLDILVKTTSQWSTKALENAFRDFKHRVLTDMAFDNYYFGRACALALFKTAEKKFHYLNEAYLDDHILVSAIQEYKRALTTATETNSFIFEDNQDYMERIENWCREFQ
jgi:hypothetical protein